MGPVLPTMPSDYGIRKDQMPLLSIVVPCYNESENLSVFHTVASEAAQSLRDRFDVSCEFIFVDDGSTDGTLDILRDLRQQDSRVRYISFSRNFGKESGIHAGLRHAGGEWVALLDADLQDPPSLLPEMYSYVVDGAYDNVATYRRTRTGEPPIRTFLARLFYRIMNRFSGVQMMEGSRDYRLMSRTMVDALLSLPEYNRFSKGLFAWVGFRTKWLSFENEGRHAGATKWSFLKLFRYSMDGLLSFSNAPLAIASVLGMLICVASFGFAIVIVIRTILYGDPVAGYPTLACLITLLSGIQLFCTGVVGEYLARMYMEVKGRPLYLIRESTPSPDDASRGGQTP